MAAEGNSVSMKGNPLILSGSDIKIGEPLPDCQLVDKDLQPIKLSSFLPKICVISSVPSLDTSVCDIMTRRFNKEAVAIGDDVVVLAISMDLPFAQKRWCGTADVKNVITLSDHKDASFGKNFGVLIKDLRLLARAVFIVDKKGIVRYKQIVEELTNEPDYGLALEAVRKIKK